MRQDAKNNFDFLRLLAAGFVLLSHQFPLSGLPEPNVGVQTLGGIGVLIFFVISGYLVAQSWERDPNVWRFFARRALRIWPGLIVVAMLTVLVLGPLLTTLPATTYFAQFRTWSYFRNLLMLLQFDLPGVFGSNPHPNGVNGSLWTLPLEVRCYLILAVCGLLGLLRKPGWLLALSLALAVYVLGLRDPQNHEGQSRLAEFGVFFAYGAFLHFGRCWWAPRTGWILASVALACSVLMVAGKNYVALYLALPLLVVIIGTATTVYIRHAARFGDLSYGIYIYAFPVQQTIIMYGQHNLSFWSMLALSALITLILALLSWHLVEQPALALRKYLRSPAPKREDASTKRSSATERPANILLPDCGGTAQADPAAQNAAGR